MIFGDTARNSSQLAVGPAQSKSAHCLIGTVLFFLVLLAWTVREVIGGLLRGGRGLLKTEPAERPRFPVHAIRSGRGVLEAPTPW